MSRYRLVLASRNHIGPLSCGKLNGTQEETATAKEISMDLSELDGIFSAKEEQKRPRKLFTAAKNTLRKLLTRQIHPFLCASIQLD